MPDSPSTAIQPLAEKATNPIMTNTTTPAAGTTTPNNSNNSNADAVMLSPTSSTLPKQPPVSPPLPPAVSLSSSTRSRSPNRSQIAQLLADTTKELEAVKTELYETRQRAEKAEGLVRAFENSVALGSGSSGSGGGDDRIQKHIFELERQMLDLQREVQEEKQTKEKMLNLWRQFREHMVEVEVLTKDSRNKFDRAMIEVESDELAFRDLPSPPIPRAVLVNERMHRQGSSRCVPIHLLLLKPFVFTTLIRTRPRSDSLENYGNPYPKRLRSAYGSSVRFSRISIRPATH
jgi:hypothetical protein